MAENSVCSLTFMFILFLRSNDRKLIHLITSKLTVSKFLNPLLRIIFFGRESLGMIFQKMDTFVSAQKIV